MNHRGRARRGGRRAQRTWPLRSCSRKPGLQVEVFEAEPQAGGAARTLALTLPGFPSRFRLGGASHGRRLAVLLFASSDSGYGLEWIHSPAPLAHPLDDGTAVISSAIWHRRRSASGPMARAWRRLIASSASTVGPSSPPRSCSRSSHVPRHPLLLAQLRIARIAPAKSSANLLFQEPPHQGALRRIGRPLLSRP